MKNRNVFRRMEELALGKGFYIVLALCLTAVGVSGYYLLDTVTDPFRTAPAAAEKAVTLPDLPEPAAVQPPALTRPAVEPQEVTLPDAPKAQSTPAPAPDKPEPQPVQTLPTVFTWPVKGAVLRPHSLETLSPDPTMGDWRTHEGVDIAAALGTRVLCMTEGDVAEIWEDDAMGTCIRVTHVGDLESVYANLSPQPTVRVGDHMEIGAILGAVGSTAAAESGMEPHLHLEVFRKGAAVDPLELLPEK